MEDTHWSRKFTTDSVDLDKFREAFPYLFKDAIPAFAITYLLDPAREKIVRKSTFNTLVSKFGAPDGKFMDALAQIFSVPFVELLLRFAIFTVGGVLTNSESGLYLLRLAPLDAKAVLYYDYMENGAFKTIEVTYSRDVDKFRCGEHSGDLLSIQSSKSMFLRPYSRQFARLGCFYWDLTTGEIAKLLESLKPEKKTQSLLPLPGPGKYQCGGNQFDSLDQMILSQFFTTKRPRLDSKSRSLGLLPEEAIKADRRVDPNVLFEQKTIAKFSGYLPEDCRATLHSATATSKALSDAADAYRQTTAFDDEPVARVTPSPPPSAEGPEAFPRTRGKSELYPLMKKAGSAERNLGSANNPATTTTPPSNIVAPQPTQPKVGWTKFERPTILGTQPSPSPTNPPPAIPSTTRLDIRSNGRDQPPTSPRGQLISPIGSTLDSTANYLTDTSEAFPGQLPAPELERKQSLNSLDITSLLATLKTSDVVELLSLSRSANSPKVAQVLQKCVELATKAPSGN